MTHPWHYPFTFVRLFYAFYKAWRAVSHTPRLPALRLAYFFAKFSLKL